MTQGPIIADAPSLMRTTGWADYALLDSGGGRKLERYGPYRVVRPEPQCLWTPRLDAKAWDSADAVFDPTDEDEAGRWRFKGKPVESWALAWNQARFHGRFTNFRHLAFFPEQAANWEWLDARQRAAGRPLKILNLFGYTGVASLVCSLAGAQVTHVDASKQSVQRARENAELSGVANVRWIVEDARRFVQREDRRGNRYDGIILDPPKFGRGPDGEVWRLFEDLPEMIGLCGGLLSDDASFLILNAYAARISGASMAGLVAEAVNRPGRVDWGELALVEEAGERQVGLSFFARWSS
ncbi:class I SAM-dependent methyltransferase [Caulobacter mirabilis]|uniref:SAM-dependent methyltransferase n=1 Tax=Caulobacter mirabilis TaxID=69666 RepID=A0A2D2AXI1_9CAUL|nr:class I SAM-dependent methyltransferase [Caulobacter mirabilis]ATQ42719.1 SAM-dependent methyltransferase [Caulobacter mirabilis]